MDRHAKIMELRNLQVTVGAPYTQYKDTRAETLTCETEDPIYQDIGAKTFTSKTIANWWKIGANQFTVKLKAYMC